MTRRARSALSLVLVTLASSAGLPAQNAAPLDSNWARTEAMIPMRDGTKLYVTVLRDRRQAGPLPIIMERTPYEADAGWKRGWPTPQFSVLAQDGYIFVFADIRGKYRSEGGFLMNRPLHDPADPRGTDESTDTHDTIEWLVHHVPDNSGRVGVMGISYPGWLTTMAGIHPHPALRAISPQAPMTDAWLGDDFFHNGAFRLSYGLEYSVSMESGKEFSPFDVHQYDMYDWYLRLGPLSNVAARAFPGGRPTWNAFVAHPAYDAYWQAHAAQRALHEVVVPTLTVGGWWDQEDRFGALETYRTLERFDTARINRIVMGPWNHGGWAGPLAQRLGNLDFGAPTAPWYRSHVEAPFFAYYLKDRGPLTVAEATVFETGSNGWRTFDAWPPREARPRELYLRENGTLAFAAPSAAASAFDGWVSDPAHPVPYRPRPVQPTYYAGGSEWYTWETMDQRFVDGRPDVMVWTSDTLADDLVIAGDVTAHLFASTTGSDADWVVKLIDVLPPVDTVNQRMGGYELMVAYEIFRGRYRTSFEHPQRITPNAVLEYTVGLHQQSYRFRRGHRLMVQVQSSWFPLYDRNPQTYVPNIFQATAADYRPAAHRVWRTARYPSRVTLPVIPN
jgi:putative CocE/NonD family hydrolase